jgi:hypothetical protein
VFIWTSLITLAILLPIHLTVCALCSHLCAMMVVVIMVLVFAGTWTDQIVEPNP